MSIDIDRGISRRGRELQKDGLNTVAIEVILSQMAWVIDAAYHYWNISLDHVTALEIIARTTNESENIQKEITSYLRSKLNGK